MMQTTSPPSSLVRATGSTVIDAADPLVSQIDALLPQTQCRQCGYEGCRPYAAALALGKAEINQCPPGGEAGVRALANLLTRPVLPLNSAHGIPKGKWLAVIDENRCIGCTLCIQACPVDAILGASKRMHTVIQQECTGCELCLPPCPVDCIDMIEVADRPQAMNMTESDLARRRHAHKIARQTLEKQPRAQTSHTHTIAATAVTAETTAPSTDALKKAALAAAMARVKAQKTE